jgi:ferredoxin
VAEGFKDEIPRSRDKPYCIVGAKACDLKGFQVQDRVFMSEDYRDPLYIREREENLLISSDCTNAIETCFCVALHEQPFAHDSYDLNLSEVNGAFLVETGSERGQDLINRHSTLFQQADTQAISARDEQRKRVAEEVKRNIEENGVPDQDRLAGVIEKNYEAELWKQEAETCVECGACNTICPTCHCFLLYDQMNEQSMARLRMWDSCMIKDFAKVAGGANPRPSLWMRLRNRFEKKFDFFPKVNDIYACTGCGRCITACPAKIDIRRVLKRLAEDV